ncbi:MAG: homoserine kinase [Chloroflexi bacterium]|nr:homoserine kinase [Chloroflexota bacterium]
MNSFDRLSKAESITIRVPATSANLGPGFDCLGMALDIWNTIRVEVGPPGPGPSFDISGQGASELARDERNLIYKGFRRVFAEAGLPAPGARFVCHNEVPLSRGLGSSTTAVVGGLFAANEICGRPLSQGRLLQIVAETEGHVDNGAAALLGGLQIIVQEEDSLVTASLPIPEGLSAVVYVPNVPMDTQQARALLPRNIPLQDAVYNIGRVALLVRAFATGDLSHLRVATEDRLHQPARQKVFSPMKNIFRAALDAGALGVFLSGAGSSVLALAKDREFTIGYEMADAAVKSGIDGEIKITKPTNLGAHVVEES